MIRRLLQRRDVFSWCLYDWANSAFVTSITTVLLQVYFLSLIPEDGKARIEWSGFVYETSGLALWGYLTGISMLAAALVAPLLGAYADQTGRRKRYVGYCALGGGALTCTLYLTSAGQYLLCGVLYVGANFLWTCGNLFYDALLPELGENEQELDAVSSAGYAIGYLGGGSLLGLHLLMIMNPHWFGLADAAQATRVAFITVGVWWVVFTVPLMRNVTESPATTRRPSVIRSFKLALRQLRTTLSRVRQYKQPARVLLAYILYGTGIGTIITIAASFGKEELKLSNETLVACTLVIQLVGFPTSFAYVALARKIGARNAVFAGLAVYLGVTVFAYFMPSERAGQFWLMGLLIALVQGGTQALTRSLYGSMIPSGHFGEFFGFFSVFSKVGTFMGPLSFSVAHDLTGSARAAVLFLAVFFLAGGAVLATVNVQAGRAALRARGLPAAEAMNP